MVDRQQTLYHVHGPRMDQPIRCPYSLIFIYGLSLWATGSRADFLNLLKNPAIIGFILIAFVFTMYHAATWFYLLGAVAPVKIGRSRTKPWQALVLNIILLIIISFLAIWLVVLR